MLLVNLRLTKSQTELKSPQNITSHSFTSDPSFSEIFGNFDQVWPKVDSRQAPKTLILIWSLERVETNTTAKIIKFLAQRLLMGRNHC